MPKTKLIIKNEDVVYTRDLAGRGYSKGRMMKILTQQRDLTRAEAQKVIKQVTAASDKDKRIIRRAEATSHMLSGGVVIVIGFLIVVFGGQMLNNMNYELGFLAYIPLIMGAAWFAWGIVTFFV